MNGYKINPAAYTGVTVLPSVIAEQHLKLAGPAQLKVILYAFSDPAKELTPEDGCVRLTFRPFEIKTVLVERKTKAAGRAGR